MIRSYSFLDYINAENGNTHPPRTCLRLARCLVTTEACDSIRDLHNRMPVMLGREGFEPWLAGEAPAVDPGIEMAVR